VDRSVPATLASLDFVESDVETLESSPPHEARVSAPTAARHTTNRDVRNIIHLQGRARRHDWAGHIPRLYAGQAQVEGQVVLQLLLKYAPRLAVAVLISGLDSSAKAFFNSGSVAAAPMTLDMSLPYCARSLE
jgi:hypothetical protein